MKKILPMLLMTVMLRVWWGDHQGISGLKEKGDGIFLYMSGGSFTCDGPGPIWGVRKDDGSVVTVCAKSIYKSKWVEVKAEK